MAFLQVPVWVALLTSLAFTPIAANNIHPAIKEKQDAAFWNRLASEDIKLSLRLKENNKVAKNIVFFLGDGLSLPTLAAARIYKGQQHGQSGEEGFLFFEKFPRVALVKTYNVDRQVPDSAGTATAFLCGVKANYETVGLDATAVHNDCNNLESAKVKSIVDWAQEAGKATGIVTTTTITHATPAGAYAHTPNRDWEADIDMTGGHLTDSKLCKDIARQLIEDVPGRNLNVIFGGGWQNFYPNDSSESPEGKRGDGLNLVAKWLSDKQERNSSYALLRTRADLQGIKNNWLDHVLGLFAKHHMDYNYLKKKNNDYSQPTLKEMTVAAIEILQRNPNGFFLLVEGGRIDHAHHDSRPRMALDETVAMEEAVEAAVNMLDESETLIIVTADHAHVMAFNGYPVRGNDVLGTAGVSDYDNMPYATLMYTNGPGFNFTENGERANLSTMDIRAWEFQSPSAVHMDSETHGGEDVAVYAKGPMAHLFHGLHEQNYVAHVMAFAACIGPYADDCHREGINSAGQISFDVYLFFAQLALLYFYSCKRV